MADFHTSWSLSRTRLLAELEGLSQAQLNWKLYPGALSIGEAVLHVAGVEVKFGAELMGMSELSPELDRVRSAATDGVVNDKPFPYTPEEITPELVASVLAEAKALVEPALVDPSADRRAISLVSALGPVITGEGAMARLGFHSAYHQGQAYQIRMHPNFPA
jgi:hypothetical protein